MLTGVPTSIWTLKLVTMEFFGRLVAGQQRFKMMLWGMRGILAATFFAIVVSDLAECRPFQNYWAVVPDPGGQCRQGYANLITASVGSALTDLLLIIFPVPIISSIQLPLTRKIMLMALFCLGVFNIIITIYRVPLIVREAGYQGTRSMWASVEILVATAVGNTLALGSFVRDTGIKKTRFKYNENMNTNNSGAWSGRDISSPVDRGRAGIGMAKMGMKGMHLSSRDVSEESDSESSPAPPVGRLGPDDGSNRGSDGGTVLSRTASGDSLIPRGHMATHSFDRNNTVVKTTTIQVTVSGDIDERRITSTGGDSGPRIAPPIVMPVGRSKSASTRGVARGSTRMLQEMRSMPNVAEK